MSLAVFGFGLKFGYMVDHNYINFLTVPMTDDSL